MAAKILFSKIDFWCTLYCYKELLNFLTRTYKLKEGKLDKN